MDKEIKQAIEFFYKLPNRIPFKYLTDDFIKEYDKSYKIIRMALEKQIPMKLRKFIRGICPAGSYKEYECSCGNCVFEYDQYCSYCGQRIDWNREEK